MRFRSREDLLEALDAERSVTARVVAAAAELAGRSETVATVESPPGSGGSLANRARGPDALVRHIVESPGRILAFTPCDPEERLPRSFAPRAPSDWTPGYLRMAETLRDLLAEGPATDDLEARDTVYDRDWPRGRTLGILLAHEIHHRGQLALLLRLQGGRVPAIYGPSADER